MNETAGDKGNSTASTAAYPNVAAQPDFPRIEIDVLKAWEQQHTFERSIERRSDAEEYVFYDGPPFANGLPHYGHLLTSFIKDTVPRYQTMRGKKVDRRFGWDCHGLPVEMEAERQLGFSGKAAIANFGIDNFNDYCATSVMKYTSEWERTVRRAARWVDFENDYKTMDLPYTESVMWAIKSLYDKGLLYEGRRVLPYCWECETPLSNFETRLDDAYRERTDTAVTVMFTLADFRPTVSEIEPASTDDNAPSFSGTYKLLAWTTTPWTLPSNAAVTVGSDITYAIYEEDGVRYILGRETAPKYKQQLQSATLVGTIQGATLVGCHYEPLFPYFAHLENAFQVFHGDFVTTEEGTGVVHMAPYGEDDWTVLQARGVQVATPVTPQGNFDETVTDFAGMHVFEANAPIVDYLKSHHLLVKREQIAHSYPHCWRSDTPLLYMPMSSWFVKVTAIKDRLVELNQQIHWIPDHVKDGAFGKWLEGARDWSISRNRFWGAPLPVWKSDDPRYPRVDVYGSLDEIARDFGVRPTDLHRPYIDQLTRPNPDDPTGASTMRRVEDVLDCWFESGSMPFAQVHYPFENKDWFDSHYPGDFIVEYIAQTRGWFYTLHVLATALFDRPPFRTCLTHGVVLGEDGRKASKKLRNYPDPEDVFNTIGADSCRFALYASSVVRGGDAPVGRKMLTEAGRRVLVPIWNAWYFLSLYGNADHIRGQWRTNQTGELDRYLLAKAAVFRDDITDAYDDIDLSRVTELITRFVDVLNNWWIRRSRDRFWRHSETTDNDKRDAYDTLHTALMTLCSVAAPVLPLTTEHIYTNLTGEESVHLTDWIDSDALPHDHDLVDAMDLVRDVCSEVLSIRKSEHLRVRLPLNSVTIAAPHARILRPFRDLIADEVNVKSVELHDEPHRFGKYQLSVFPGVVGPRIGAAVQKVLKAAKAGEWEQLADGTIIVADTALQAGEYALTFLPKDESSSRSLENNAGVIVVDTVVTPELEREGAARDLIRGVQAARREADLQITDRIRLSVAAPEALTDAFREFASTITAQTLASNMDLSATPLAPHQTDHHHSTVTIDGADVDIAIAREPEQASSANS